MSKSGHAGAERAAAQGGAGRAHQGGGGGGVGGGGEGGDGWGQRRGECGHSRLMFASSRLRFSPVVTGGGSRV
eukprot:1176564-Prorocentrum_minimum.AAC.3